jgi:hypothetical protein
MPPCVIESFGIGKNENVTHKKNFGVVDYLWNEKADCKCPILPHSERVHPSLFAPIHPIHMVGVIIFRPRSVELEKRDIRFGHFANDGIWLTVDLDCRLQHVMGVKIWRESSCLGVVESGADI